jgi:hypothetical protein
MTEQYLSEPEDGFLFVTTHRWEVEIQLRMPWHDPAQPPGPLGLEPEQAIASLSRAFSDDPLLMAVLEGCVPLYEHVSHRTPFFEDALQWAIWAEEITILRVEREQIGWLPVGPGEPVDPGQRPVEPRPRGVYDLWVHVYDTQGKPLEAAAVDLTGPTNRTGPTDEWGDVYFGALPAGRYHVRATHRGYRDNQGDLTVPVPGITDIVAPNARPNALRGASGGSGGSPGSQGGVVQVQLPKIRIDYLQISWVEFVRDHQVLRTRDPRPLPTSPHERPAWMPTDEVPWDYAFGGELFSKLSLKSWDLRRGPMTVNGEQIGRCFPVSCSAGDDFTINAELLVGPAEAPPEDAVIEAQFILAGDEPKSLPSDWHPDILNLRSDTVSLDPARSPIPVTLRASRPLPKGPAHLRGELAWLARFKSDDRLLVAGTTGVHNIYVTFDWPWTGTETVEAGVTHKRMRLAARCAHVASGLASRRFDHLSVLDLVRALHRFHPDYGFSASPDMSSQYCRKTHAVAYTTNVDQSLLQLRLWAPQEPFAAEWGGAWPHGAHFRDMAECQALVRLAYGIMKQLGVKAKLEKAVIFAHPDVGILPGSDSIPIEEQAGQVPIYQPFADEPRPETDHQWDFVTPRIIRVHKVVLPSGVEQFVDVNIPCTLALVGADVTEGKLYPFLESDKYEAVLRVETDEELCYYAGGMRVYVPQDRNLPPEMQERDMRLQVLHMFAHLVWLGSYMWNGTAYAIVAKVVASYHR